MPVTPVPEDLTLSSRVLMHMRVHTHSKHTDIDTQVNTNLKKYHSAVWYIKCRLLIHSGHTASL